VSRGRLRREVFGGESGTCVLHGDTPTTLLSAAMAHRAGLDVAHLEAGLRSHSLAHPFPEELIRLMVMRRADLLFAPDAHAARNLRELRVHGRVIPVSANTVVESLRAALGDDLTPSSNGAVVITVHRVENLHRARPLRELLRVIPRIAKEHSVEFVTHGPTRQVLEKRGFETQLTDAGVRLVPLLAHSTFVERLRDAPFVITDGGSIQEECALLGVPTLLWRARTEREDGLGANVVLSDYDSRVIDEFIEQPQRWRRPPVSATARPSEEIVDALVN
jgi:UDP-N-acetylglucosamine 2-epimerase